MSRMVWILFLALALVSCGGGGGGSSGTAPKISNLQLSRTFVPLLDGDGLADVQGTFDYEDPEADIVRVEVEISDGTRLTIPIPIPLPSTVGIFIGVIQFSTTQLGVYTSKIWVVDAKGLESNRLSASVTIAVDVGQWTEQTSPTTQQLEDVAWNGARFVAVGAQGTILSSPDGAAWTARDSGTTSDLNSVMADGTKFLAVGDDATILTSDDGIAWTRVDTGIASGNLNGVARSASVYVAGGERAGSTLLLWSADGQTWHEADDLVLSLREIHDVAWSGTAFVATTFLTAFPQQGSIMTSPDGVNWSEVAIGTEAESVSTFSITWTGDQFMAGGTVGRILLSPDGVNWSERDTGSSINLWAVGANPLNLVAGGNTGVVGSLDGGMSWEVHRSPTGFRGLAWGNNRFVAVGQNGRIHTAP